DQICNLIKRNPSCSAFIKFVNFLDIFFCGLNLPSVSLFGLVLGIILLGFFSLLHMLTKYFFMPNLVTLMEFAPVKRFGFCYVFVGLAFNMPDYLSDWPSCAHKDVPMSPLQFTKHLGGSFRSIMVGIMVICLQGSRIEGVTVWSSMMFIILMLGYVFVVVRQIHDIDDVFASINQFRATVFLLFFSLVLFLVLLVSNASYRQNAQHERSRTESFSDLDSDDEVLGKFRKQTRFSRSRIWLKAVNGYYNMGDCNKIYRAGMVPFFFIFAHLIPVLSLKRYMYGWCKYITCISLILSPFICLRFYMSAAHWLLIVLTCWIFCTLVCISTHSQRRPDHVWVFAALGIVVTSISLRLLCRLIEGLMWQYVNVRFAVMPDQLVLLYFGMGEIFCEAIMVNYLQQLKLHDAAFGVVMSLGTYDVTLIFPLMVLRGCYDQQIRVMWMCGIISLTDLSLYSFQVIITGDTETAVYFLFLVLTISTLHISMSGFEFRISLFIYLLATSAIYVTYQWMVHFYWIVEMATL
ncbi:hypothetical protein KR009_005403, partial [Drosophila setifemur]